MLVESWIGLFKMNIANGSNFNLSVDNQKELVEYLGKCPVAAPESGGSAMQLVASHFNKKLGEVFTIEFRGKTFTAKFTEDGFPVISSSGKVPKNMFLNLLSGEAVIKD